MEAQSKEAAGYASALWLVPREYIGGGRNWLSRAIHDLSREMHPILAQFGQATVGDLPEADPPGNTSAEPGSEVGR